MFFYQIVQDSFSADLVAFFSVLTAMDKIWSVIKVWYPATVAASLLPSGLISTNSTRLQKGHGLTGFFTNVRKLEKKV